MNCTHLSAKQRDALKAIKSLEGKIMTVSALEHRLELLGDPFEENTWFFTCQQDEYNDEWEEGDEILTEILSDDIVELGLPATTPYQCEDGRTMYIEGDNLYEIWMTFKGDDPSLSPSDDDTVVITEVVITLPEELWNF